MQIKANNLMGRLICACFAMLLLGVPVASAQSNDEGNSLRQGQTESVPLTAKQTRLADRYDQLELLAGRLAELSRATQPRRARLLRELVAKSRERDIAGRFDGIISALNDDSLGKASTAQGELQVDLQKLLDLLLQEDRDKQIESERKRIRKYLAEVKRLIQLQRGIKARTDGGDEKEQLTENQKQLAESTAKLEQLIKATEGSESSKSDRNKGSQESGKQGQPKEGQLKQEKPEDGKPSGEKTEGKPSDKQQEDGKSSDEEKSSGKPQEGQPQEGQQSPSGKSTDSPPSQGQSQPSQSGGEPSEQSPESPQGPAERAQQRLKKAQQRMQQALERLEEAKRDKAVDRQEQALRELEQAKAELERILRQLREEELERMLVLLEARFRKMLDAQVEVYEQTKKLEAKQSTVPEHEIEIASGRLDRQERLIVREAERALVLLREDGTTVAFPEAIEQARDDMQTVAKRLGEVKIAMLTQGLEEDIITALEETLAALQQAIKKARAQKSRPQQSKGSPGEKPLVDQLAELRMIRALQNRINRRTKRYGEILGDQPAIEADLLEELNTLARRQERIFEATRDLDSGRNQ